MGNVHCCGPATEVVFAQNNKFLGLTADVKSTKEETKTISGRIEVLEARNEDVEQCKTRVDTVVHDVG